MPVPVALLNVSNPSLHAVDTLSRLSHDTDIQVAQNAVLALGEHLVSITHMPWCLPLAAAEDVAANKYLLGEPVNAYITNESSCSRCSVLTCLFSLCCLGNSRTGFAAHAYKR